MNNSGKREKDGKPTLEQLVVERALVSREHLELCLAYREALREDPTKEAKTLGDILIEKGLLRQNELDQLEEELQTWESARPRRQAPVAAPPKTPGKPDKAPAPQEAEGEGEPAEVRPRKSVGTIAVIGAVAVAVALGAYLWPASGGEQALSAYLESCAPNSEPKSDLAIGDLGIVVRTFEIAETDSPTPFDYRGELRAYGGNQGVLNWQEFLDVTGLTGEKRRALAQVLPAMPGNLKPENVGSLAITVQPIRCRLVFKPRESKLFKRAQATFTVIKVESSHWNPGWKVTGYTLEGEE